MDQFSYVGIQYVDFAQYLGMLFCLLGPQNIELPTDSELPALPDGMGKMSLKHIAKSMIGLAIRYVELQLFGYLQRVSNETCFEDDEDQHAYILCLLRTLTTNSYVVPYAHQSFWPRKFYYRWFFST